MQRRDLLKLLGLAPLTIAGRLYAAPQTKTAPLDRLSARRL